MKTIKTAIKSLPKDAQLSFLSLWETCGCMDLYSGDLKTYIQVIDQRFIMLKEHCKEAEDIILQCKSALDTMISS